ncbi:MAG TPA: hypothetical protein VFB14_04045 [Bryobacteraceae bacterium]|nr:hypothetical protein [Bryobacteraceae bacterium]
MTPKLLRLVYVLEFLVALIAIFTSWSEIGGQAALDLMHWGWKLGFGAGLAAAIVAYTAALVSEDSVWSLRSARWLTIIILVVCAIGIVTYYYMLQEDTGEPDDGGNVSMSSLYTPLARLS